MGITTESTLMGFVALRNRCPWSDHRKCAAYDRMSEATLVCCYGDGWIVIQGSHEGVVMCGG
jgi:hypothetical protein